MDGLRIQICRPHHGSRDGEGSSVLVVVHSDESKDLSYRCYIYRSWILCQNLVVPKDKATSLALHLEMPC